ncbi:MAG: hypothetical protein IPF82_08050 [Blastocatellia bacterium]|nr:hypothetical protein [Blastocatellia bacterium]
MSKEDAPTIGGYLGMVATIVLALLLGLGRLTGSDDSAAVALFPYAMAIGSPSGLGSLVGVLVGAVQWPSYGFAIGSVVREREPLSLPYAASIGLLIGHIFLAAYLGR